jgi:acetyl-CoA synthetase
MPAVIQSFKQYQKEYKLSVDNPEGFWAKKADTFTWHKKWDKVLDWNFREPNITENCLDRHLDTHPDKPAIVWEPNDPNDPGVTYTYRHLHAEVCKFANVLKSHGVGLGDRVCLYMPMVPELAIAVLACARIGAIHSVVFGGFSANALSDRINDSLCKILVTADGGFRGNKEVELKNIADEALVQTPSIQKVIVLKRTGSFTHIQEGRDLWWHDEMKNASPLCPPTMVESEQELFILYTSGSTGKPKGVVHTTAGYMVYAHYTFTNIFQPAKNDVYWCTADIWLDNRTQLYCLWSSIGRSNQRHV